MNDTVNAAAPIALTKEQKIAKIREQIGKLEARIVGIETGREIKVAAAEPLPDVGSSVSFFYGRRTATTEPVLMDGVVIAVKPVTVVNDKRLPAQVKVQIGSGFDTSFVTVYPAQLVKVEEVSAE